MSAIADHPLIGTWRIVEADLWDRDYLDLVEQATISFGADGRGTFVFGACEGGMDLEYAPSIIFFTWSGFDEMDEVSGSGSAELNDEGQLEIEPSRHLGDDVILKARRQ
jgi:hypothetical protein